MKYLLVLLVIPIALFLYGSYLVSTHRNVADKPTAEITRPLPKWWNKIPLIYLNPDIPHSIYPYVYFPEDRYIDLMENGGTLFDKSIVVHEREHLRQNEEYHPFIFTLRYLTSKRYRLEKELDSFKEQFRYLKENNGSFDIEWKAEQFVGKTYGNMLQDKEVAIQILTHLWEHDEIIFPEDIQ